MDLRSLIRDVPDFPKPGIVFKDITTLTKDPDGFRAAVDAIATRYADANVDLIVGIDLHHCAKRKGCIHGVVTDGEVHEHRDPQRLKILLEYAIYSEARVVGQLILFSVVVAGELAQHRTAQAVQLTGELELPQHSVDAVRRFANILDEQDGIAGIDGIGRAFKGRDHRQIAAGQPTPAPALAKDLRLRFVRRDLDGVAVPFHRLVSAEGLPEILLRKRRHLLVPAETPHRRRRVEGHQARTTVEGRMQTGDVGKADDHLGMGPNRVVVQAVENPHGAVTPGSRENGVNLRVEKGLHQFFGPSFITAGEVALDGEEVLPHLDRVAEAFEMGLGLHYHALVQVTRRRHELDRVARLQPGRLDQHPVSHCRLDLGSRRRRRPARGGQQCEDQKNQEKSV